MLRRGPNLYFFFFHYDNNSDAEKYLKGTESGKTTYISTLVIDSALYSDINSVLIFAEVVNTINADVVMMAAKGPELPAATNPNNLRVEHFYKGSKGILLERSDSTLAFDTKYTLLLELPYSAMVILKASSYASSRTIKLNEVRRLWGSSLPGCACRLAFAVAQALARVRVRVPA